MAEDGGKLDSKNEIATSNANHKPNGDFAKGNTASVGRQQGSQVTANKFKLAFQAAISETDIQDIAKAMLIKARAGDVKAAKEVMDRCMGKPEQPVQVTGDNNNPIIITVFHANSK